MEYDDEENACVNIPECGAILMSSTLTKKECFKRHVFALSSCKAQFVKHVKAGMILFLFEYEKRQLFGVFQATSDGTMDIVPHGFYYSGRHFPAQVRFKPIWFCHPLHEKEFKDAIRENYFSPKKFKFDLSEDQVRRLLSLFSSRKVKKNLPYRIPKQVKDVSYVGADYLEPCKRAYMEYGDYKPTSLPYRVPKQVKDLAYVGDDSLESSKRAYVEYDDYKPSSLSDYQVDSFIRAKEYEVMERDVVNDEGKVHPVAQDFWTNKHVGFLSKRRRVDYEDRLLIHDVTENENYADHGMLRSPCIDAPIEVRRFVNGERLVTIDKNYNENQVDKMLNPVSKYPVDPLEAIIADYDQYMQRNSLFSDSNSGDGLNEHYSKLLNKHMYAIGDNAFLNDDGVQRDCNSLDRVKPLVCSDRNSNLFAQTMNRPDNHQLLLNEELESRYQVCDDGVPVTAFEWFTSPLHRARRTSAGGMFPNNNRTEGEHEFITSVTRSSCENFPRQLDCESRTLYDRKLCLPEGRVTDKTFDNNLCSTTFRSRDRVENVDDIHTFVGPAMSKHYSLSSKPQQIFSSFEKFLPETRISRLSVSQNHDLSYSTFDDPTTTRAAPYISVLPKAAYRRSASEAADWNSSFGQETHPYQLYSLSKSSASQLLLDPLKSSKFMGQQLEDENKSSSTNTLTLNQSSLPFKPTNSLLNPNLFRHRAPNTCTPVDCGDSIRSRFSLPSPPFTCEIIDGEKRLFPYQSISDENLFASYSHLQTASQYVPEHSTCNHNMESKEDFICSETNGFAEVAVYHPVARDFSSKDHQKVSEASSQSDPNTTRRSVFTRLTSGKEVQVGEDRNDAGFISFDHYMAASADEVMEMLLQGNNLPLRMPNDPKVVAQPNKPVKGDLDKKQIQNHIDLISPNDSFLTNAESVDEVPKETRIVDYKRRSEKKKSFVGTTNDPSAADMNVTIPKGEAEYPTRKTAKHKRLVRPVFVKTESASEVIGSDNAALKALKVSEVTHVSVDKQNCRTSISNDKGEVQNDDASLSSHKSPHDKKNDHSQEQQKDLIRSCSLQVHHEKTTQDQNFSLENSTILLSKEVDSTVESLKHEEPSSEKSKSGASCSSIPIEGKKVRPVKRVVKKVVKTRKVCLGKGQNFEKG